MRGRGATDEAKTDSTQQNDHFGIRLFIACVIFAGIVGGLRGLFTSLAETSDWVLEYRYWIQAGSFIIGGVPAVLFFFLSHPKPAPNSHPDAPKQ